MPKSNMMKSKYTVVGALSALGGLVLGVSGTVLYNKLLRKKSKIIRTSNEEDMYESSDSESQETYVDNENSTVDVGVYIQDHEGNRIYMTNNEFQEYFELHVTENENGVDLDTCFLDHALKLEPLNLRFFSDKQKTPVYERMAVDKNVAAIQYCKHRPYLDTINNISYEKYEIEEYAYSKHGDIIYKYIDNSHLEKREMLRGLKKQITKYLNSADTVKSTETNSNTPTTPNTPNTSENESNEAEEVSSEEQGEKSVVFDPTKVPAEIPVFSADDDV